MKDFERKKKTNEMINNSFNQYKEIRARTQGKFADFTADNSAKLYKTDIAWKKKANPIFNQAENHFYKRDFELMSKRRYQKVMQAMQLEHEHGIHITRMPDQLKNMSISPNKKRN